MQQRNGQSAPGALAGDSAPLRARLGMARSCPTIRLLKEPTRRIRFLSQAQALTLLRELPPHLREMATFALATGLRAANVTGLIWDQVDLSRKLAWVHPDQAKARKATAVPLNDMAMRVIMARQAGILCTCSRIWESLSSRSARGLGTSL